MNAREALIRLVERTHLGSLDDAIEAGIAALREKVERDEKERPKVPLSAQIAYVRSHSHSDPNEHAAQQAAADTLRRLEEEGGKLLNWHFDKIGHDTTREEWVLLLRSLGVEERKP